MTTLPKLKGLVLGGGKSSRMKEPKAWINYSGLPQWKRCEEILSLVCDEVFFSTSPLLTKPIDVDNERLIEDIFVKPCGPLGGIISAFYAMPNNAFFVLACDMPKFNENAVQFLLSRRSLEHLATVFVNQQENIEPLCGIYEPAIFPHLLKMWSQKKNCPRKILSCLDVKRIAPQDFSWLKNINFPHEIESDDSKKKLRLNFYASLRESMGCSSMEFHSQASNVAELFSEISRIYNLSLNDTAVRFAKNNALVDARCAIHDGDSIIFIPPVSGG
ncbi:MAG: NTP transferase domain-containing protein [Myxococcales bacterium]|nr:NTP transferase domain-containing protein [Myxococcales bacterium]USN50572.1 MAG: NTP transferase domain-containing protein [Myxococcales bacterium]